jgi:hypothetical protein
MRAVFESGGHVRRVWAPAMSCVIPSRPWAASRHIRGLRPQIETGLKTDCDH